MRMIYKWPDLCLYACDFFVHVAFFYVISLYWPIFVVIYFMYLLYKAIRLHLEAEFDDNPRTYRHAHMH